MANLGEITIDINANISKAQAKLKQLEKQLNLVVDVKLPKLNSTGTTAQYKGSTNDDCCDRLLGSINRLNSTTVNGFNKLESILSSSRSIQRETAQNNRSNNQATNNLLAGLLKGLAENTKKTTPPVFRQALASALVNNNYQKASQKVTGGFDLMMAPVFGDFRGQIANELNKVTLEFIQYYKEAAEKSPAKIAFEEAKEYQQQNLKKEVRKKRIAEEKTNLFGSKSQISGYTTDEKGNQVKLDAKQVLEARLEEHKKRQQEFDEFVNNYETIVVAESLQLKESIEAALTATRGNFDAVTRNLVVGNAIEKLGIKQPKLSIEGASKGFSSYLGVVANTSTEKAQQLKTEAEVLKKAIIAYQGYASSAKQAILSVVDISDPEQKKQELQSKLSELEQKVKTSLLEALPVFNFDAVLDEVSTEAFREIVTKPSEKAKEARVNASLPSANGGKPESDATKIKRDELLKQLLSQYQEDYVNFLKSGKLQKKVLEKALDAYGVLIKGSRKASSDYVALAKELVAFENSPEISAVQKAHEEITGKKVSRDKLPRLKLVNKPSGDGAYSPATSEIKISNQDVTSSGTLNQQGRHTLRHEDTHFIDIGSGLEGLTKYLSGETKLEIPLDIDDSELQKLKALVKESYSPHLRGMELATEANAISVTNKTIAKRGDIQNELGGLPKGLQNLKKTSSEIISLLNTKLSQTKNEGLKDSLLEITGYFDDFTTRLDSSSSILEDALSGLLSITETELKELSTEFKKISELFPTLKKTAFSYLKQEDLSPLEMPVHIPQKEYEIIPSPWEEAADKVKTFVKSSVSETVETVKHKIDDGIKAAQTEIASKAGESTPVIPFTKSARGEFIDALFGNANQRAKAKREELNQVLSQVAKHKESGNQEELSSSLDKAHSILAELEGIQKSVRADWKAEKAKGTLSQKEVFQIGQQVGDFNNKITRAQQALAKADPTYIVPTKATKKDREAASGVGSALVTTSKDIAVSGSKLVRTISEKAHEVEAIVLTPVGGQMTKRAVQAGAIAVGAATIPEVGAAVGGAIELVKDAHLVVNALSHSIFGGAGNSLATAISHAVAEGSVTALQPLLSALSKIPGMGHLAGSIPGAIAQSSNALIGGTVRTGVDLVGEAGLVGSGLVAGSSTVRKALFNLNAEELKAKTQELKGILANADISGDIALKIVEARELLRAYQNKKGNESAKEQQKLANTIDVVEATLIRNISSKLEGMKTVEVAAEPLELPGEEFGTAKSKFVSGGIAKAKELATSKSTYEDLGINIAGLLVSKLVEQIGGEAPSIVADIATTTGLRAASSIMKKKAKGELSDDIVEELFGAVTGNLSAALMNNVTELQGIPLKGAAFAILAQRLRKYRSELGKESLEAARYSDDFKDLINALLSAPEIRKQMQELSAKTGVKLNNTIADDVLDAISYVPEKLAASTQQSVDDFYKELQQIKPDAQSFKASEKPLKTLDIVVQTKVTDRIKTYLDKVRTNLSSVSLPTITSPFSSIKRIGVSDRVEIAKARFGFKSNLTPELMQKIATESEALSANLETADSKQAKVIQKQLEKLAKLSNIVQRVVASKNQSKDLYQDVSPEARLLVVGSEDLFDTLGTLHQSYRRLMAQLSTLGDNEEAKTFVEKELKATIEAINLIESSKDGTRINLKSGSRLKNIDALNRARQIRDKALADLNNVIAGGDYTPEQIGAINKKIESSGKLIKRLELKDKVFHALGVDDLQSHAHKVERSLKSLTDKAIPSLTKLKEILGTLIASPINNFLMRFGLSLSDLKGVFQEALETLGNFGIKLLSFVPAAATLAATIALPVIAIAQFGKQAIETARQFNLLETTINSFGGGSTLASNLSVASKELINLKSLAQGLPQYLSTTFGGSLEGDAETYISLQKSLANRGIGGQQAERANSAILQMLSKGKVSMEELRQQLSEALPGTMQIAARAYNQSVGEFVKAVSKGTIGGDDFYNRFVKQLAKESTGFGDNQAAQLTKLQNAWDNLGTKAELALGKILLGFASFSTGGLLETLESAGKAIDYVAERAGIFIGSLLALSAIQLARPIWLAVEAITFANATGFKLAGSLGLAQKAAAGFGAVMKQGFLIGGVLALADVIQGVFTSGVLDSVKAVQSLKKELNSLPQDTAKPLSSGSGVLDVLSGITRGLSGGNVKEFNKARRANKEKEISAEEFEQLVNPVGAMKRIENNDAYAQKLGSIGAELIGVDAAVNKITLADKKVQDFIARVKQLQNTKAALQVQIIADNITPEQRDQFQAQIEQIQAQMDALKLDVIPNGDPAQIEAQIDAIKRAFDDSVQKGYKTEADRPAMEALVSRMRSTSAKIKGFWKELENTTNISTALKKLGDNFEALRTKIDTEDSQRKTSVTKLILSRSIKPEEEGLYQQNNAVEQARDKWKSFNEQLQQTKDLINSVSTSDLSVLESVIGKSYKDFNSADIEKLKSQGEIKPFEPSQQAAIEALEKQLAVTKELEGATNSYGDALVAQQKANDEFIRQLHTIADIMAIVKGYADGVRFENTFKVAANAVNSSAYLANNPQLSDYNVQAVQFRDRLNEALNNKNSSDYSVKIKVANLKALRYGIQAELNKLKIGDVSKMDMAQLNQLEATLNKINKVQPVSGDLMAYVAGYKEVKENQLQVLQDSKALNDVTGEINKWKFENWTSFGITIAELNTKFAALTSIAKELNEVTDRAFSQKTLSNLQSSTGSRSGDSFRSQQEELQRLEAYTKNAQAGLNQLKEAFSNWEQPKDLSFEGDKFTMPIQAIQNLLDSAANGTIKLSGESKAYLETLKNIRQQSDDLTAAQTRLWTEIAERQIPAATRALIDYQATIGALEFKLKSLSSGSKIGILRNAIANQSTDKDFQRADRGNNIQLLNEELRLRQRILKAKEAAALVGLNGEEKTQIRELFGGNPLKATRQELEEALGILNAAPKVYSEGVRQSVESLRQLSDEKLDFKRAQENQLSAVFDIIKSQQDLVKSIKNAAKSLRDAVKDLQEKQAKLASFSLYNFNDKNPETRFNVPKDLKFSDLDSQIQSEIKSKEEAGKSFINSIKSLGKEYESLVKDLDKNIKDIRKETEKALKEITTYQLEAAGIRKYGNQGFAADMFKQFNDVFKAFNDIGDIEEVDGEKFKNQLEGYQERISQATEKEAEAREELANKIIEANQKIAQRFEELAKEQEKAAEEVRAAQEKVAEASQELASLTNDYNANNSLLNSVGVEFKGAAQEQISAANALKQAAAALGAAAGKPINLGDLTSLTSAPATQYQQPQYNPTQPVAQYQAPANLSELRAQLQKDIRDFNKRVADRDRERAAIEKAKKYAYPSLAAYSQPTNWNELAPRFAKMQAVSIQLAKEYQQLQVRTKQLSGNITTSVTQSSTNVASANQAVSKAVNRTGIYQNGTVDIRNMRYNDPASQYTSNPRQSDLYKNRVAEGRSMLAPWESKARARMNAFRREAERNIQVNVQLNTAQADVKLAELEAKIKGIYIDLPRQLADKQRQAQDATFSYREYQNQYLPNRNDSINFAGDKIESEIKRKAEDMRLQARELRAKDSKTLDINDFASQINDLKSSGKVGQDVIENLEEKLRQAASGSISLATANEELITTLESNANDLDKIAPTAAAIERIKLAYLYSQNLAKVQQDISSQLMEAQFQSIGSGLSPYYEKRLRAEMELANFATKAADRRQSTIDTMRANKASNDEIERTISLLDKLDAIEFSNLQRNTKVLQKEILDGLGGALEQTLSSFFKAETSLGEAFANLGRSVLQMFADIAAKAVTAKLMGWVGGLFGMGGGGLPLFKDGGEVGVKRFAMGGNIPCFDNGGTIQDALALGLGVKRSLALEGNGAVPVVAHKGEQILTDLNGDAQLFRALQKSGEWTQIKSDRVNRYATGGTVGYAGSDLGRVNNSRDKFVRNNNVNTQITVVAKDVNSFVKAKSQIQRDMQAEQQRAAQRLS